MIDSYCSIDGTDSRILEPALFDYKRNSHEFNRRAVRYEMIICNARNLLKWNDEPFCFEKYPDLNILKSQLNLMTLPLENMVAVNDYQFSQCVTRDSLCEVIMTVHANLRARHKTCFVQLSYSNFFDYNFRHNVCGDETVLHAVAKQTALTISQTGFLFTVRETGPIENISYACLSKNVSLRETSRLYQKKNSIVI